MDQEDKTSLITWNKISKQRVKDAASKDNRSVNAVVNMLVKEYVLEVEKKNE